MEKIKKLVGYGIGDFGLNIYWKTLSLYLLYFYTTVIGLDPRIAGSIFFIGMCWDAISDPIMASLSERVNTKFGTKRRQFKYLAHTRYVKDYDWRCIQTHYLTAIGRMTAQISNKLLHFSTEMCKSDWRLGMRRHASKKSYDFNSIIRSEISIVYQKKIKLSTITDLIASNK